MMDCESEDLDFTPDERPSQTRGRALRERCLSAALALFLQRGYAATTLEEIAFRAGVTRLTLYRRFVDKDRMFRAVIDQALDQAAQPAHRGALSRSAEPRAALLEIVERLLERVTEPVTLALRMAMAEKARFPDLAEAARAVSRSLGWPVVDYLTWANQDGKLSVNSPERAAAQIFALAFSANYLYGEGPISSAAERQQWAEEVVNLLMHGWTPRRPATPAEAARKTPLGSS